MVFVMDSKAIIAIAVVAVVVVAGVGAFALIGKGSSDSNDNPVDCKLRVLGNANQDNYLDQKDVDFIQDIVDGKTVWNRTADPLVDANNDGIIDTTDVNLVKGFINGTKSTMYYMDWNNSPRSVTYPLTEVLGSDYGIYTEFSTGLDMGIILGIYDRFTYMANGDIGPSGLDLTMYPNADKMTEVGIKTPSLADMYSGGVRILMGDPKWMGGYADDAEAAGFTVIRLPENRTLNGVDALDTLITLGVMFKAQDKTAPFIEFLDKVNQKVQDAVNGSGANVMSYVIPYTAPGLRLLILYPLA
jgi:iron complex transport system substrate-binding protein